MNRTLVKFEGVVVIDNLEQFHFVDKIFNHYYRNTDVRSHIREDFERASVYNKGLGERRCINFFIQIGSYPRVKFRPADFGCSNMSFYVNRHIPLITFMEFLEIQGFVPITGKKYYVLVPDNKKIVKIKRLQYEPENVDLFRFCNFFPIEDDAMGEYYEMLAKMKDLNIKQWECKKEKK